MWFKKNKESKQEKAQPQAEAQAQYIESVERAIVDAEKSEDPARRVLRLQALYNEMDAVQREDASTIREKAVKSGELTDLTTSLGGFAVAGALVPVTGGLSMIATLPMMIGGTYAGVKRRESIIKKKVAENKDYVVTLDALKEKLATRVTEIINDNVEGISASPVYAKVMNNSALSPKFSAAAAKYVQQLQELKAAAVVEEAPVVVPEAVVEKPVVEVPVVETPVQITPHEKQDFTRFTQFGRDTPKKGPQPPKL